MLECTSTSPLKTVRRCRTGAAVVGGVDAPVLAEPPVIGVRAGLSVLVGTPLVAVGEGVSATDPVVATVALATSPDVDPDEQAATSIIVNESTAATSQFFRTTRS